MENALSEQGMLIVTQQRRQYTMEAYLALYNLTLMLQDGPVWFLMWFVCEIYIIACTGSWRRIDSAIA